MMLSRGRKAQFLPCLGGVEFATRLWIICAILTLVASQQNFYVHSRYGKRQEPRAESFFVAGSRIGRSEGLQRDGKSLAKIIELVPRVDRFFWGSRYGKRSSSSDHQTVSSMNRFGAVLDYVDRVNRLDHDRKNDVAYGNDLDILS